MAQEADFPVLFIRSDHVDNTKPSSFVYVHCLSNTAVNGHYPSFQAARDAVPGLLVANIESAYKSSVAYPNVFPTYRTNIGAKADILWTGLTAGTAAENVTIAYTAATAATTATVAACVGGSATTAITVTLAVTGGGLTITSTAAQVIAAVAADTGAGAHAANFLVGTAVPTEMVGKGTGVVTNMAAQTIKQQNTIMAGSTHQRSLNARFGFGKA